MTPKLDQIPTMSDDALMSLVKEALARDRRWLRGATIIRRTLKLPVAPVLEHALLAGGVKANDPLETRAAFHLYMRGIIALARRKSSPIAYRGNLGSRQHKEPPIDSPFISFKYRDDSPPEG